MNPTDNARFRLEQLRQIRDDRGWLTFAEAAERLRHEREVALADEAAERYSEARVSRHVAAHAARNFHE